MDEIARLSIGQRTDLFVAAASQLGLSPVIVEKDFWVCWLLKRLLELMPASIWTTPPHAGPGGDRVCVAFADKVGRRCSCTIYEDRPRACQGFEIGGLWCRLARHAAGLGLWPQELRQAGQQSEHHCT